MDSIAALKHLCAEGFTGTRQFSATGELTKLIYCRWWTGDHVDVVVVRLPHDAEVLRISGVNPRQPHELSSARLFWRDRGEIPVMVAAALDLSAPQSAVPLKLRTLQASRCAEYVAAFGSC